MNKDIQDKLKQVVRGHFGPCEMRFYDDSVTVTLIRDFGKYTVEDLHTELYKLTNGQDNWLRGVDINVVSPNRFKIHSINDTHQQTQNEQNESDENDLDELRTTISNTVDEAHEATQLETLLKKEIERDMEEFIFTNLGAAMIMLERSKMHISLDETKELMRFSYLSGLWKNARERDLQVLADVFNTHFEKYSQNWNLSDVEGGQTPS